MSAMVVHRSSALTDGVVALRPPTLDDGAVVVAAIHASLPELAPWMPWATADYGLADHHGWVTGSARRGDRPLLVCLGGPDGEVVGSVGLNQVDVLNRRVNLGYWLRSDRTGRGYARRSVVLTATWAVEHLGFRRIDVVMAVGNTASQRVAEGVGAHREGVLRGALALQGAQHDAHVYSLLASEVQAWNRDGGHR